jgi:site-specific DNA-cytosine methylase
VPPAVLPAALPAVLPTPVDHSRPLRLVSLFDGYGGTLIALLLALAKSVITVEVAHAADIFPWKVALAAAVAAASSAVHLAPPLAADITDASVYTAAFIASWGAVDLLVAGFPCVFHSEEGRRKGVTTNLRTPACKALVDGFFRVLSLATARIIIVECSARLLADPYYETDFRARLAALGYWVSYIVLDANAWLPINRKRVFIVCFRSAEAYEAFTSTCWVMQPPQREARVDAVLLPPRHALLPRSCYDAVKSAARRTLSVAAQAVAGLPILRGKARSAIGVFKRDKFSTLAGAAGAAALKGPKVRRKVCRGAARGVLPTLIKSGSGVLRVRDAVGTRSLCARECGALHGVPAAFVEAMLAVALDARVVAAIGDGFAISVVRDLLKAVLRAGGWVL